MHYLFYFYARFLCIFGFVVTLYATVPPPVQFALGILAAVSIFTIFKDVWEFKTLPRGHVRVVALSGIPNLVGYVGTAAQFEDYFGGMYVDADSISMSAVKHPDGTIYAVSAPGRHHHCFLLMDQDNMRGGIKNTRNQGFITNYGEYVSRKQAKKIAILAGQVDKKKLISKEFTSEELW